MQALWLYDSFEGLPDPKEIDGPGAQARIGCWRPSLAEVESLMAAVGAAQIWRRLGRSPAAALDLPTRRRIVRGREKRQSLVALEIRSGEQSLIAYRSRSLLTSQR